MLDMDEPHPPLAFAIVGVGASSGGLEGFTQLLRCLPPDTGLAFVLIQHLDRTHPSLLREVLAKATTMPVLQAEHEMPVEPSHVYVIPPNADMAIHEGRLVLSPRTEAPKAHLPVDFFMRSLAAELGGRAIGVILSGSASDGTDGLRAIRAEGGITFVQDPRSAKFASMPQSALDAGVVDHCMGIDQLADELVRLSRHPYVRPQTLAASETEAAVRDKIFARVRDALGVDFSEFKLSTVTRRLARRMALRNVVDLSAYLVLLDAEPDEIRALYEDMLIHVTSFFRDPELFDSLRTLVFPQILEHKPEGGVVRIWVAGCSTGEEVYSLAIALLELPAMQVRRVSIQIFGSDVSEAAIQKARAGTFSDGAMHGVSDEQRKRFFAKVEGGYRINKAVREHCVFVRHDLVRDPPFSKQDIVSCRNVLIYFDQGLQKKVLPTLHYCLNQPGFLVLGRSENVTGLSQLFSVVDKTNKIFARTAAASSLRFVPRSELELTPAGQRAERIRGIYPEHGTFAKHLDRLLLARYCPPGVLVDENMNVLLFRGHTGSYLQAAPGQPQNNLISMARGGLIAALRTTIAQAKQDLAVVTCRGVEVDQDGPIKTCDVVVVPFVGLPDSDESRFIVLFEESGPSAARAAEAVVEQRGAVASSDVDPVAERRRNARLEHELAATKEYLHTLVEEHGRASDELGTSNEELISGNEELQSMNEELETAKEELQSINEELTTLNDELRTSNQEVTQANTDLLNFALTVDVSILTLDMDRRIRRFTPKARSLLNVLPADVGRSIDDIKLNIDAPDLNQRIADVIATSVVNETEVRDRDGRWFRMQIRPYALADGTIDGAIVSLVDIHHLKQLVAEAEHARSEAERANCAKDDFLATLSHELRTPLSSMLLNAQRLRSGEVIEPADLQRAGESLERATWMQVKLIDDLLDVSRIVADKLTLDSGRVDLCATVQSALDGMASLISAKSLVFRVTLDPALEPIWADRVRVHQVASNLLTNAIKFTPRGGQVTVVVDAAGGFARLRVTDTGIGIETDFLPHVFTRFSQRDRSITRKYGGLGLGLALVRHLVEVQGGTADVESQGPGHGSSFAVTFPLARTRDRAVAAAEPVVRFAPVPVPVPAPAPVAPVPHALDRPGRTLRYGGLVDLRVLFVDDDLRTREAVLEVLELSGARVELAGSAAEGASAVDSFNPQVILCDIAMPGEDGYTFIRKLRARESGPGPSIPALALTALASAEDHRRALAAGFQLHLAKPIDIDRLRDAVLELSRLTGDEGARSPAVAP